MLSLARSVITQATRGGRCVVPRRNLCSPPASQEAKGAGERIALAREAKGAAERIALAIEVLERVRQKYFGPVVVMSCGYVAGYITNNKAAAEAKLKVKKRIEQIPREAAVGKSSADH